MSKSFYTILLIFSTSIFFDFRDNPLTHFFDTNSMKSTGKIPAGNRCWHFSFTPDNKKLIVACGRSNDVLIIDVASKSIEKRFESLKMPWGVVTYPKSYGTLDTPN